MNFNNFYGVCKFMAYGCDGYGEPSYPTCRKPGQIPPAKSWGTCDKEHCPYCDEAGEVRGINNLVYICSPYRGEVERNLEYARELTRLALDNSFVPITPHLYLTQVVNDEDRWERERGMSAGKELLRHCKYILIGSRYGLSEGMLEEIKLATRYGKIELAPSKGGKLIVVYGGQEE